MVTYFGGYSGRNGLNGFVRSEISFVNILIDGHPEISSWTHKMAKASFPIIPLGAYDTSNLRITR